MDFIYFEDLDTNNYNDQIRKYGGRIYKFPSPFKFIDFRKQLKDFCSEHYKEYDIFHYHFPFLGVFFIDISKLLGRCVVISHAHATKFGECLISNLRNGVAAKLSVNVPDYYFACSKKAGVHNFGNRFNSDKGYVVNNAIQLKHFVFSAENRDSARDELGMQDKFVVGHIGNFTPQKNHIFIIDVFNEILKRNRKAELLLIGDGYLRACIKEKTEKLGIASNVHFTGVRNDVGRLLSGMDLFLFPSLFEGLGIALIEAQTNGLPCLVSDVIPEEAKICNCIELSLNKSAKEWSEVALRDVHRESDAYDLVKNAGFDLDIESTKLVDIYRKCIKDRGESNAI
ncbi:glycosyltransferase [Blautia schinkii]|nr:glycosyltransferase [Blautia schinkii]